MSMDVKVCGIDPGIVNMSTWIGTYSPETHKIKTAVLSKCACGDDLIADDKKEEPLPHKKKQSVQASSADSAVSIADACLREKVDAVVIETAPQWNVPIRLSAATIYGALRGRGVSGVRFSSPSTKAKAIEFFAERLGIADQLEVRPENVDKKASARIRLVNKRNSVRVAAKLLKHSEDDIGLKAFGLDAKKQDDMADAILLACGTAFEVQKQRAKTQAREAKRKK
jgi:hypothetical protein